MKFNITKLTLACLLAASGTIAVAAEQTTTATLPKCEAPVASIMVGKLNCKAANCANTQNNSGSGASGLASLLQMVNTSNSGITNVSGIADGIKDVLVTALTESGCFDVQDREQMDEISKELALTGRTLQVTPAEFLVSGAVTQIDVSVENKSFGGGLIPILGSIGSKTQKAEVALDMKLVSVDSAKVLASKRATASTENSSLSVGALGGGAVGGAIGGFGGSYSTLKGSNLEAVTKVAIIQSVAFLVEAARTAKGAAAQPAVQ